MKKIDTNSEKSIYLHILCEINVFDIYSMVDFLQIFVVSQSTEIESNFWREVYV